MTFPPVIERKNRGCWTITAPIDDDGRIQERKTYISFRCMHCYITEPWQRHLNDAVCLKRGINCSDRGSAITDPYECIYNITAEEYCELQKELEPDRYKGDVMEPSAVLALAIKTYGKQMQMDILIEEMAELIKELIKTKRRAWKDDGKYHLDRAVFEEYVDVRICLEQMEMLFKNEFRSDALYHEEYEAQYIKTLNRLLGRIGEDRAGE